MSEAAVALSQRVQLRDLLELSKARIVVMIAMTTAAGFVLGSGASVDVIALLNTVIGTALVAAGTNALNQYFEREHDAKMKRTRLRPLPDHRLTERTAFLFSAGASVCGIAYLALTVHWLPAVIAFLTLFTYLAIYTPLKRVSPLCTIIGAIPGALPPVIGWAGARHDIGTGALLAFLILFIWQMPHFLAIGWMYREDYGRAGFAMLSVRDNDGTLSGRDAVLYSLALIVVSVLPLTFGVAGGVYAAGAVAAGLYLLAAAIRFASERSSMAARKLFMASNLYLPVVMALLVFNRLV